MVAAAAAKASEVDVLLGGHMLEGMVSSGEANERDHHQRVVIYYGNLFIRRYGDVVLSLLQPVAAEYLKRVCVHVRGLHKTQI